MLSGVEHEKSFITSGPVLTSNLKNLFAYILPKIPCFQARVLSPVYFLRTLADSLFAQRRQIVFLCKCNFLTKQIIRCKTQFPQNIA